MNFPDKIKILLLIDNPLRDLPGLILLGCHLASKGCNVYLTPMNLAYYNRNEEVLRLSPDLVVANYLRLNNRFFFDQMRMAGINVSILDTEGGILVSCQSYLKNNDVLLPYYSLVKNYFSWGPKLAKFLIESKTYQSDQVIVTGSPRHDYYVPPWDQAARTANTIVGKVSRPIILLNSNFPAINPAFQTPANEKEMLVKQHGLSISDAEGICNTQKTGMVEFAQIANRLAKTFPSATVVFRPHPFESEEPYKTLLDRRDNLQLIKKGTVDGWILEAACVVQRGCSTAVEAGIAGVPTFSPLWIPMHLVINSAESVSIPIANIDELENSVGQVLSGNFNIPDELEVNLEQVIDEWFCSRDGLAHARVGDGILAGLRNRKGKVDRSEHRNSLYRSLMKFSFRERIKGAIGAILGLPPNWAWVEYKNGKVSDFKDVIFLSKRWFAFWGYLFGFPRDHIWFKPFYGQWPAVDAWKNGSKAFTVDDVNQYLTCICKATNKQLDGIKASQCELGKDYVFGDHPGVSVKIHL